MLRATTRATRLVLALSSTVGQPLSATPPTFHMAAVTFNPLVLSAKASVRGAAVRRAGAKASKRAAFAVKASDDDMDFMVRAAAFFRFRDGARIDASRRRATGRRGERGRDRHARRATPRRAAFGSTPNASRSPATDGCAVSNRRRTIRRFANAHLKDAVSFSLPSCFLHRARRARRRLALSVARYDERLYSRRLRL
jgi:hypothetical protein